MVAGGGARPLPWGRQGCQGLAAGLEGLITELLCSRSDRARREDLGGHRAEIGDPRPGVGVCDDGLPDILWRAISNGEIEIEGHGRLQVPWFHMVAYPVTHAQFAAFIDAADGFGAEEWWTDLDTEDPVAGRIRRHGNHPATHGSWYDTAAFCRWLSRRLGFEVRLPDEWEWQ